MSAERTDAIREVSVAEVSGKHDRLEGHHYGNNRSGAQILGHDSIRAKRPFANSDWVESDAIRVGKSLFVSGAHTSVELISSYNLASGRTQSSHRHEIMLEWM